MRTRILNAVGSKAAAEADNDCKHTCMHDRLHEGKDQNIIPRKSGKFQCRRRKSDRIYIDTAKVIAYNMHTNGLTESRVMALMPTHDSDIQYMTDEQQGRYLDPVTVQSSSAAQRLRVAVVLRLSALVHEHWMNLVQYCHAYMWTCQHFFVDDCATVILRDHVYMCVCVSASLRCASDAFTCLTPLVARLLVPSCGFFRACFMLLMQKET